jgi:hypothetical protein
MKARQSREATRHSVSRRIFNALFILVALFTIMSLQRLSSIEDDSNQAIMEFGARPALVNNNKKSSIRFVMFLGIEGTGHHFWQDLIKESPLLPRLKTLGLHPEYTTKLTRNLYRHKKSRWKGLWSSTCKWEDNDPTPNITSIQESLVDTLRTMNQHVANQKHPGVGLDTPILFPVNLLAAGDEIGVVSYPGFLKPCRALNYPNLDVWYQACETAGVTCQHAYIYRNPYSVIKSTVDNRPINKEKLEAIHLYTTQLHVLHSQLLEFPDRLIGCLNYNAVLSPIHWKDEIEPLLEFQEQRKFADVLKRVFRPKPPLTDKAKRKIVPAEFDSYMASMVRLHETVVQTCKSLKHRI